jgi:hypothetical protein
MNMTHYDFEELYPNRFLKGVQFKGRPVTLTIVGIEKEELGAEEQKKTKVILSFKETKLQLIANKLNCTAIMLMFGRNTKDWLHKRVTFHPLQGEWFGTQREAIRVLGSPDISKDMKASHQLGREVQRFHLKKVVLGKKASAQSIPEPAPEPGTDNDEFDPVTGEVQFNGDAQAQEGL